MNAAFVKAKQKVGQSEWKRLFGSSGESMRSSGLTNFFIFERAPALEKSNRDATLRSDRVSGIPREVVSPSLA
jgi:hypothetical protein